MDSLAQFYREPYPIRVLPAFELRRIGMQAMIFVAITVAFFALSIAYVRFCDRVK